MTKILKNIYIVVLIASLSIFAVIALNGCTSKEEQIDAAAQNNFVGTWDIVEFRDGDNDLTEMIKTLSDMGMEMNVTITEDNKIDIVMVYGDTDETSHGTWEAKNETTIVATIDGSSGDVVLSGDQIIIEQNNQRMVCQKRIIAE